MKDVGIKRGVNVQQPVELPGPASKAELEEAALRGAKALVKMTDSDRDAVVGQVPGLVKDIAQQVVGGPLDNHLLTRNKKALAALIQQGANPVAASASAAGARVADLRSALVEEGGQPRVIAETAKALASIAAGAGATKEDFDRLVGRLEVLAALQGEKRLAMISNRALKMKIANLTNGNLGELAAAVGKELASLAYDPVRKAAVSEHVV